MSAQILSTVMTLLVIGLLNGIAIAQPQVFRWEFRALPTCSRCRRWGMSFCTEPVSVKATSRQASV